MRTLNWRLVAIAAACGLLALLVAVPLVVAQPCPSQCPSGKIPLGFAAPMTGPATAFGRHTTGAAQVSIQALNSAGGLLGLPAELVIGDDSCNEGIASEVAARHIKQDKVAFVVGPVCPEAALAVSPTYAKAGVVQFAPTVTRNELTRQGFDNVFRMVSSDEQEALALGAYFTQEHKGKKLAVVYGDIFYKRAIAEKLRESLPADAKAATRFEPVLDVPGAYDRLATKLQRDPPDLIYIALDTRQFLDFVGKLRQRKINSVLLGGQFLLSQGFWFSAREAAEGIRVLAPIDSLESAEFRKAVDLLQQAKVVPDLVALSNFATVQTWAEAVRRAGSGDPKKVIAALRSDTFDTAIGRVVFDQFGDRRDIHYSVLTWKGGHLRP
jgi:branched-chain amino acid transport system substrate-binding protein